MTRGRPTRLLVFGVPPVSRSHYVLPIPIAIENRSAVPAASVHVQIELPAHCLLDGSAISDSVAGSLSFGALAVAGRTTSKFPSIAQVSYDVPIVRSRENVLIHEVVRIPTSGVPDIHITEQAILSSRWSSVEGFCSALNLRIYLAAATAKPIDVSVVIAVVNAATEAELTRRADALIAATWDNQRFARVGAIERLRRRFARRTGLAQLTFLERDALVLQPSLTVDSAVLRISRNAVMRFNLPPWGLSGRSGPYGDVPKSGG